MFPEHILSDARATVALLKQTGLRVATAESLTAGTLAGALACVPGASEILDGGFVAYSYAMKTRLLGVPADLLATKGAVDEDVARLMAEGALDAATSADLAVSCTGVAGPGPSDGKAQGTVFVALAQRGARTIVQQHQFAGDRDEIRLDTIGAVLALIRKNIHTTD